MVNVINQHCHNSVNRVTTILVDHIYHKCHNFFEKKILGDVSIPQVGSGCWGNRPLGRVGSGLGIEL